MPDQRFGVVSNFETSIDAAPVSKVVTYTGAQENNEPKCTTEVFKDPWSAMLRFHAHGEVERYLSQGMPEAYFLSAQKYGLWDGLRHFPRDMAPGFPQTFKRHLLCKESSWYGPDIRVLTEHRDEVTCLDCLEWLHA